MIKGPGTVEFNSKYKRYLHKCFVGFIHVNAFYFISVDDAVQRNFPTDTSRCCYYIFQVTACYVKILTAIIVHLKSCQYNFTYVRFAWLFASQNSEYFDATRFLTQKDAFKASCNFCFFKNQFNSIFLDWIIVTKIVLDAKV